MADRRNEELHGLLERLTNRFWSLSTSETLQSEGLTQMAVGLNAFLDELRDSPDMLPQARLRSTLTALTKLADALDVPPAIVPGDDTPTVDIHLDESVKQFVDAFRSEARKRLAGLSLSLTGVFNSEQQAIDQTINHLHAIRGGAGMLGLQGIAKLAGAMEDVVLTTKKSGHDRWPVRPLLRGFATLESAIDDPESGYDNIIQSITDELRGHLSEARRPAPAEERGFGRSEDTDVRKLPLNQRILVVDDVETIAHSVGLILSDLDLPIDVARDGLEALNLLRDQPYSLVISDIAMPNMDGLQLTRTIRHDENLSDVPVILLTALDRPEERQRGFDAGASDYIVKGSIGGGELLSRVRELLKDAPVVPTRADEQGPFRNVLIVEDVETIAASIAFVLSDGPYEISLAHNGREALELLRSGDFDLVLSDVEMPEVDGYELLDTINATEGLRDIPVILLTGRESDADRSRAMKAGASRFLIKGEVGSGKLLRIVGEFFQD